ncbi:4-hydroxy-3-methylbut-2-enyl diphosphate reductase [Oribacterium sp. C9]|uniref:4-hydroxy-3-methylbut-2-enyl diphosphate reductase n=1 Tax=Oribacterium sp. C9 TaxID=1943579 RepID=UPI0009902113|nr:4-hydroxy-3-methylbut-2-enyl diphosphate reductase [Oribacterium sp. C9]OON85509.1 4-hydroxy-3-methylbut-2-enyl diphosphate reductase [Oribacterium sp. C9]
MNVTLAKTAGFCFGVQRAVDTVYEIIDRELQKPEKERKQIYTYGPIVHNETVVDKISSFGVEILNDEDDLRSLKDGIVIIRAHGVPRSVYSILKERCIEIVDASCPFVQKIQKLANKHSSEKEKVFIVGNPEHPEVIGIMGWAEGSISAIPDIESAEKLPNGEGEKIVVLSQTTFNADKFKQIIEILKKKFYDVNAINTICNATFERQSEAKELARRSDAMIVIGGSSSSNTKKLYEICKDQCPVTQLIQTVHDLNFSYDGAIQNVGITAGASTPKEIIEEVQNYVRNEF